jgi:hypothetical protein
MNRSTYPLKLPASVKRAAQRLAAEDGVSLNQWIAVAVAQKVGVSETAAEFFARRAADAEPADLIAVLRKAPDTSPDERDRLPIRRPRRRRSS